MGLFLIIRNTISLTTAVLTLQNADHVSHVNVVVPPQQTLHRVIRTPVA